MKIAVIGAGAVGCYYGGLLARAGHAVVLVGRSHHVDAICRDGLLLDTQSGPNRLAYRVALEANTDPAAVRGASLVLCCVKSADTEQAARDIGGLVEADALVLSLQNGVENADLLRSIVPCEVVPVSVYAALEMVGAGRVKHHGGGALVIGQTARRDVLQLFSEASIPIQVSDDIQGELWKKLTVNCAYNALSAITSLPYGQLVQHEGVEHVLNDVVAECLAVARKAGVKEPEGVWDAVVRIAKTMPSQYSSTAQDLKRGRKSEIDHLNGYVIRKGMELSVPTPANRILHSVVKALETR